MEAEIAQLKAELQSTGRDVKSMKVETNGENRVIRTDLSANEQIALQREMAQLDRMLTGYMEENKKYTKAITMQKDLEERLKLAASKAEKDAKKMEDYEMKLMKANQ